MNIIKSFFQKVKTKFTKWRELGGFYAMFSPFGTQIYKSDIVRACIRTLAEHTSKANPRSSDKRLEYILTYRPNLYMNGKDFLAKCRNLYEVKNTLFILLERDEVGRVTSLYPIPYSTYEALDYEGELFISFTFAAHPGKMIVPWADLAVMRKDYLERDIGGEDNSPIMSTLELINVTNQGLSNAVKSTANLRGILKTTKAMLDEEDRKEARDNFVNNYMSFENGSGIGVLDASQEFTPVKMEPTIASFPQMKEFRENVYRYFGVNDDIIMSKAKEDVMESFYSSKIEHWLVGLSLELTDKAFTYAQKIRGAYVMYESSRLQYCSQKTKLSLVSMVDRGAMTPNEWRNVMNMAPIEGGDKPIRRLDTAEVKPNEKEEGEGNGEE